MAGAVSGEGRSHVVFLGPLPPPVHGQAVSTACLLERLRLSKRAEVRSVDTGEGTLAGVPAILRRLGRTALGAAAILATSARRGRRVAYLSVNARLGLWLTLAQTLAARAVRCPIVLHHHTNIFHERERPAAWLLACAGREARHIVLCCRHGEPLVARGVRPERLLPLSNAFALPEFGPRGSSEGEVDDAAGGGPIVLGHLGNLSFAKGLRQVVETAAWLAERDVPVVLLLAGPPAEPGVERFLDEALRGREGWAHRGPLYGADKEAFLRELDFFLFPSRNEAEGLVALEALRAGVPVIASSQGCLPRLLEEGGGLALGDLDAFPSLAGEWILSETARPSWRRNAIARASGRFARLRAEARAEERRVLDALCGG